MFSSFSPPLTYCHTDSSARHGETDVIGEGDVDAKHPRVIEELAEDQLTIWRRRGRVTDGFHRCDTVSVRNNRAHLIWQAETKMEVFILASPY